MVYKKLKKYKKVRKVRRVSCRVIKNPEQQDHIKKTSHSKCKLKEWQINFLCLLIFIITALILIDGFAYGSYISKCLKCANNGWHRLIHGVVFFISMIPFFAFLYNLQMSGVDDGWG